MFCLEKYKENLIFYLKDFQDVWKIMKQKKDAILFENLKWKLFVI